VLNDNLRDSQIKDLLNRVRDLETRSPLRSSSITSGRLRVGGTATLLIDSDGGLVIDGQLTGEGDLEWTGPVTFTGTTRFEGDTTQVGAHHVQGNQDITGTLAVKGATTVENDLTVKSPGKVILGTGMQLEPMGAGGGAITFLPSGSIAAGLGKITMVAPDLTAIVTIGASAMVISGGLTAALPLKAGAAANVHIDSAGKFWRIS